VGWRSGGDVQGKRRRGCTMATLHADAASCHLSLSPREVGAAQGRALAYVEMWGLVAFDTPKSEGTVVARAGPRLPAELLGSRCQRRGPETRNWWRAPEEEKVESGGKKKREDDE
jgi:hypothetical protein